MTFSPTISSIGKKKEKIPFFILSLLIAGLQVVTKTSQPNGIRYILSNLYVPGCKKIPSSSAVPFPHFMEENHGL